MDVKHRKTSRKSSIHSKWEEYELRKKSLQQKSLSSGEYEQAIRRLADELGL